LQQVWERLRYTLQLQLTTTAFQPTWNKLKDKVQFRNKIVERLEMFQINNEGNVRVIPIWHATQKNQETINSICSTGFANLTLTDGGFFGKGIYGTPQAEYAARVYGQGVCILCFAFVGNVFPVMQEDMASLLGAPNYVNCDTHYAPVFPKNKNNPNEKIYIAINEKEKPVYDEFVIFNRPHIIPRYVVYYSEVNKENIW